jgi:predicted ArsR family transcriptional regulator
VNLNLETEIELPPNRVDSAVSQAIRPVDQWVLELLRREEGLTVSDLVDRLDVTPTAVRIRLDRLEEIGLVERRKQTHGRGRPVFQYFLSPLGWRQVGVTYTDLAMALWQEMEELPDAGLRNQMLARISRRMGRAYGSMLADGTIAERMKSMASLLSERKIPCDSDTTHSLPVLTVLACPFPDLAAIDRRSACELETQMLSEALGEQVELSCCRLDGHGTCQFRPVGSEQQA